MIISGFSKDFPWYDEEKSIRFSNALCLLNPRQFSLSQMSDIYSFYKPTKGFFLKTYKIKQVMSLDLKIFSPDTDIMILKENHYLFGRTNHGTY